MKIRKTLAVAPPIKNDDALFLDFDGTLVEIAPTPHDVRVDRRLPQLLLAAANRLDGAAAVISGRSLDDLSRLLQPFRGALAGVHGFERRTASGEVIRPEDGAISDEAREMLEEFAGRRSGLLLEDKGAALALHFRSAPERTVECLKIAHEIARRSDDRVAVIEGKMVVELRPRDADKGKVIASFLAEYPFRGRRPLFVGDDRTDEDGFVLVNRLGGLSIHVGEGGNTSASFRLPTVNAVIAWLSEFALSPQYRPDDEERACPHL